MTLRHRMEALRSLVLSALYRVFSYMGYMREDFNRSTLMHDHMYIPYQNIKRMITSAVFDQTFFFFCRPACLSKLGCVYVCFMNDSQGRTE